MSVVTEVLPRDVFPEELWLSIFDKLPPSDLCRCYETSSDFRISLRSRRTTFLFHEIILLLEPWLRDRDKLDFFLTCRLVCRSWKFSVDSHCQSLTFFQTHRHHDVIDEDDLFTITFKTKENVDIFCNDFEDKPPTYNPFVSRTVLFIDDDDSNIWDAVPQLLELFGRHIWYCGISMRWFSGFSSIYTFIVKRYTDLLPNLRVLSFERVDSDEGEVEGWSSEELLSEQPLRQLDLIRLTLKWLPALITRELVRAVNTPKLEFLSVNCYRDFMDVGLSEAVNLKSITANFYGIQSILALQLAPWPLEFAALNVDLGGGQNQITIPALIESLGKFRGTLENLELNLGGSAVYSGRSSNGDINLRLRLPKLKGLWIVGDPEVKIMGLDFLQELGHLETFYLKLSSTCLDNLEPNPEEVIQFSEYMAQMEESNIWKVLPNLKSLEITIRDNGPLKFQRGEKRALNSE